MIEQEWSNTNKNAYHKQTKSATVPQNFGRNLRDESFESS